MHRGAQPCPVHHITLHTEAMKIQAHPAGQYGAVVRAVVSKNAIDIEPAPSDRTEMPGQPVVAPNALSILLNSWLVLGIK